MLRRTVLSALVAVLALVIPATAADTPGVTATEVKIGNTNPYSGPASAYGTIGKVIGAYFKKVNDEGGVNGRKINYITYDDAYSPPKTVEMVRKLVEQDQVALLFQTLGTPTNSAIHKYLNEQKVPHLFVATGATKWATRGTSRGPWAGSRPTRPRGTSTPSTSSRTSRTRRSASSTRTTITGRTTSRGSRTASAKRAAS